MKHEEKIEKYIQDTLGPSEPLQWISSIVNEFKDKVADYKNKATSLKYIITTDVESYKKEMDAYVKKHPNSNIKAAGFMLIVKEE